MTGLCMLVGFQGVTFTGNPCKSRLRWTLTQKDCLNDEEVFFHSCDYAFCIALIICSLSLWSSMWLEKNYWHTDFGKV